MHSGGRSPIMEGEGVGNACKGGVGDDGRCDRSRVCRVRPGDDRAGGPDRPGRRDRRGPVRRLGAGARSVREPGQPGAADVPGGPGGPRDLRRRPGRCAGGPGRLARIPRVPGRSRVDDAAGPQRLVRRELPRPRAGRLGPTLPRHKVVDTLPLARRRLPHSPDHRLDTLAQLLGLDPDGSHRALPDSLRVKGLWVALDGPLAAESALVSYPIFDPKGPTPAPTGWENLAEAIAAGGRVRMEYTGGTRGATPREVSPRAFVYKGGVPYLVAFCHLDAFEKSFRLDRVVRYEVVGAAGVDEPRRTG